MIHIATVHYKSDRWIDIQASFLRRNLHEPYQLWANLEGVEDRAPQFDHVVPTIGQHPAKLNLIAAEICAIAAPDDLIMFLDGDAFPIHDPMPIVLSALSQHHLVAVQRAENGDPQPHPSFAVTTVQKWIDIQGDWSPGYPWEWPVSETWKPSHNGLNTDSGANLLRLLQLHHKTWLPLLRVNRLNLHPMAYGIYGGIVYHHGAGFRNKAFRMDRMQRGPRFMFSRLRTSALLGPPIYRFNHARTAVWARAEARRRAAESERIVQEIKSNPTFYERFL